MIKLEKILIPTDFSSSSENAMRYAVSFAKEYNAELIVLHVIKESHRPKHLITTLSDEEIDKIIADEIGLAKKAMEQFVNVFGEGLNVQRLIKSGIPVVEIVESAKEEKVDLIVMGTHGQTGTRHALIGSVAERVVRNAPCPVFTVKPLGFKFEMPYE
jgi:nucleotide-binding universal stress UspA family protein